MVVTADQLAGKKGKEEGWRYEVVLRDSHCSTPLKDRYT